MHEKLICEWPFTDYIHKLFECLDDHIKKGTRPQLDDKKPPTLASTGPEYESLNAVAAEMEKKRRGGLAKPHHIVVEEQPEKKRGRTKKVKDAAIGQGASSSGLPVSSKGTSTSEVVVTTKKGKAPASGKKVVKKSSTKWHWL